MTARFASLMSVPVKRIAGSMATTAAALQLDYGLLLNRRELARFDGCTDELPVLIAYRGRIYDVTGCAPLAGEINWRHYAGKDCTAVFSAHPRRDALLTSFPCVGALED
jgi:predicted heme/steroid binding protein